MTFDFDTPPDRRDTDSEKWGRFAGCDVIPAWVADMDFASPPPVLEALHRRVDHGVFGYPAAPPDLTEALHDHLLRDYAYEVSPDWLVWLPGLVSGLNVTCRAVAKPGEGVLTNTPVYPPFLQTPPRWDCRLQTAPLVEEHGRWVMDFDRLKTAADKSTRLFILSSPHNPTGRVWEHDELSQLADFCQRRDIVICSDEIHNQLLLDESRPHLPTAGLGPDVAARTITLLAPSKTYNIAGLGCSVAIIPDPDLRRRFKAARAGIVPGVNILGYAAALAAYRDGGPWLAALLDYLRDNARLLIERIGALSGLRTWPVEATYLAWIDATRTGLEDPTAFFVDAGVGLSDGREFGAPGCVRLNFGCNRALLMEVLDRMERALDRRNPDQRY